MARTNDTREVSSILDQLQIGGIYIVAASKHTINQSINQTMDSKSRRIIVCLHMSDVRVVWWEEERLFLVAITKEAAMKMQSKSCTGEIHQKD